ncbi:MAG: hypothetical protein LBC53_03135 [Spirochaetaceae bacterium]|nr:hypothetical protein [Spirochaetaceae bacterium]
MFFCAALPVCLAVLFFSCSRNREGTIEREDLWTFRIGLLEDQINLYNLQGKGVGERTAITMKDGLFYIANGDGGKVLRYNSYGDILFMIYNEETNPPPITLKPKTDSVSVTRWSVAWPLQEPSAIAVDSQKNLYVADKLSGDRHSYDVEEKVLLNYSVLRFDMDGNFIDYLGREGQGGGPFPPIEKIYVSKDDELAVVCNLPKGAAVYWFSPQGVLLYTVKIQNNALPAPEGGDNLQAALNGIAAAPDSRSIYVKIDYYHEILDELTQTIAGVEPDGSILWTVDAATSRFINSVEIPFYKRALTVNNRRVAENLFYTMFGVMNGGGVFFYFPVDAGFSILIMDGETGEELAGGLVKVDDSELQFCTFSVSETGILSAMLADNYNAKLVWWRTDKLLN